VIHSSIRQLVAWAGTVRRHPLRSDLMLGDRPAAEGHTTNHGRCHKPLWNSLTAVPHGYVKRTSGRKQRSVLDHVATFLAVQCGPSSLERNLEPHWFVEKTCPFDPAQALSTRKLLSTWQQMAVVDHPRLSSTAQGPETHLIGEKPLTGDSIDSTQSQLVTSGHLIRRATASQRATHAWLTKGREHCQPRPVVKCRPPVKPS